MKPLVVFLLLLLILFSACKENKKTINTASKKIQENYQYGFNLNNFKVINDTLKKGESFGIILDRHHVSYPKINQIATTIRDTFDVRKIRSGKPYTVLASKDSIEKATIFIYKHNKVKATVIHFKDSTIKAYTHKKPIKLIEKELTGKIYANFSTTMDSLGIGANLTHQVADIYAWTLDFLRLQKGDEFKLIFEEKYINDTVFAGYGSVKAALFKHNGKDLYAYQFVTDSVKQIAEYYDSEAGLLRRQFLKSPIKFKYRISSRYNLRRRIKLYGNRIRPHKGTDFAAPYNTPIMTTASGTVIESARRGGNGNYVKVKHNATYTTQYLHMKRRKVRVGDFVKQGDIIGWVGMTGNTSGPHVCYRFWKNGKQVDPFKQKLPTAKPMEAHLKPLYFKFISPLKNRLNSIQTIDTIKTLKPINKEKRIAKK